MKLNLYASNTVSKEALNTETSLEKFLISANTALGLKLHYETKTLAHHRDDWRDFKKKDNNKKNNWQPWRLMSLLQSMSPLPSPPRPRESWRKGQRAEISAWTTRAAHAPKHLILRWVSALKNLVKIKARPLIPSASIPWKGENYINRIFSRKKIRCCEASLSNFFTVLLFSEVSVGVKLGITFTSVAWKNLPKFPQVKILQTNATLQNNFRSFGSVTPSEEAGYITGFSVRTAILTPCPCHGNKPKWPYPFWWRVLAGICPHTWPQTSPRVSVHWLFAWRVWELPCNIKIACRLPHDSTNNLNPLIKNYLAVL